jgi:small-conductance mechanosensitive channel
VTAAPHHRPLPQRRLGIDDKAPRDTRKPWAGWVRPLAAALLCWLVFTLPVDALAQSGSGGTAPAGEARANAIAPGDIPSRADTDEKFAQNVQRRVQASDAVARHGATLAELSAALGRLTDFTDSTDLTQLSVLRLESLARHWQLYERAVDQARADLARDTVTASEGAADLAQRRSAWQSTSAEPYLSPALAQRSLEMVALIDQSQDLLAAPLGKLLELGRKGNALSTQAQAGLSDVVAQVVDQDRRLAVMDAPLLWQAIRADQPQEAMGAALRHTLEIETNFTRAHDAANARLLMALGVVALLLLPAMLLLKRRARRLVEADALRMDTLHALARPWAAWLLLVAGMFVLYDVQGPNLRRQTVMALAWVPVLGLLQRRIMRLVGPWAYLSAMFYLFNVVVSMLVNDQWLYRVLLLALTLAMLLALGWHIRRARPEGDDAEAEASNSRKAWALLSWLACTVLAAAALANVLGNVSLASMLVSATLDSSYAALAMYAGSKVLLALVQVVLAGPMLPRVAARHADAVLSALVSAGRLLMVAGWGVFTLQAFRVYRPVSTALLAMLNHEFRVGELSLSLGGLLTFGLATWLAFWLARTVRSLLANNVLPGLSLPRGVGNSISTLTYYTVLFLGLLSALAAAGFHVGQLALIFGALGVGIGFGLQDVVRNFISGLILMFERPIQRGDTVEVAGMLGRVSEIGLRATTVTTFEGADVVVPNGLLLANKLINWTLRGTRRRVNLDFGVAYSVNPRQLTGLLTEIARNVQGVAFSPAPAALVVGFADGVQEISLRAWTLDHTDWLQVRSELAMRVRDGLAEAGIELVLPQRDLRVRRAPRPAADPAQVLGENAPSSPPGDNPPAATPSR